MGRTAALPFAPHRQQHGAAKTAGHAHIGVFLAANLHQSIEVRKALATRLSLLYGAAAAARGQISSQILQVRGPRSICQEPAGRRETT
jgi:hypothetical protein